MAAQQVRVTHISRPENSNIHAHITRLWSGDWSCTLDEAIRYINTGQYNFYVQDANGLIAYVGVISASNEHRAHVRTYADQRWTDNLLSLPRR